EALHADEVLDRSELGGGGGGHLLRGRGGRAKGRVLIFDRLELAQEDVELGVGHDRAVKYVIAVAVLFDLLGQVGVPFAGFGRNLGRPGGFSVLRGHKSERYPSTPTSSANTRDVPRASR